MKNIVRFLRSTPRRWLWKSDGDHVYEKQWTLVGHFIPWNNFFSYGTELVSSSLKTLISCFSKGWSISISSGRAALYWVSKSKHPDCVNIVVGLVVDNQDQQNNTGSRIWIKEQQLAHTAGRWRWSSSLGGGDLELLGDQVVSSAVLAAHRSLLVQLVKSCPGGTAPARADHQQHKWCWCR